jgi:tRNA nucleotidyltransferase (CCA-adding enzyme)
VHFPCSRPASPQEEKQRKLLRVRLDMAKFLQETLRESGLKANAHIVGSDAFKEFFRKVLCPHYTFA